MCRMMMSQYKDWISEVGEKIKNTIAILFFVS